jgi:hypothetical protein
MQGINAISPTGRALQAATEKMTPQQQEQYLMQQQQSGVPLNPDLALMMIQLNRLKQAKPPAPPPTQTVKDELSSGVAQLAVPDQMYGSQGMAAGGIVAFSGAGLVGGGTIVHNGVEYVVNEAGEFVDSAGKPANAATKRTLMGKMRTIGNTKITKSGITNVAGKAGKFGKAAVLPAMLTAGAIEAGGILAAPGPSNEAMPMEVIRNYYADKGIIPESQRAGAPYDSPFMQSADDLGLRGLAMGQKMATLGFTGPERPSAPEPLAAPAAPPAAAGEVTQDGSLAEYMQGMQPDPSYGGSASVGIGGGPGAADVSGAYRGYYDSINRERAGISSASEDELAAKAKARRIAAGEGKAREARAGEIADDLARMPKDQRRDAWLAAANAFFKMGEAAGSTGSFMGAASTGAISGMDEYTKSTDKRTAKQERLKDSKFMIDQAGEAAAMSDLDRGAAEYTRNQSRRDALGGEERRGRLGEAEKKIDVALKQQEMQVQTRIAGMVQAGKQGAIGLQRAYVAAMMDPKLSNEQRNIITKQALDAITELERATNYQYDLGQDKLNANSAFPQVGTPAGATGDWGDPRVKQRTE